MWARLLIVLHDLGKFSESSRGRITGAAAQAVHNSQLIFTLSPAPRQSACRSRWRLPHARSSLYAAVARHNGRSSELDDCRSA